MRKIKIISIVLVNLLVIILLTSCTNTNDEDKEVIESFLNSYFEQFNYSEEDWENLIQKLDAEMLILGKDEIDLEKLNNLDDDSWLKAWEETLTAEEIERLVKNRLLPNLYLNEYKEVKYSIEEIKKTNDSGSYSAKIKFTNVENKNDEKEIHILLDMVDTEQGRRIQYVDLEEFKNLFQKK
jgi:hypothetical protein